MQQKQQHNRVSCIKAILPLLAVVQADARMQIGTSFVADERTRAELFNVPTTCSIFYVTVTFGACEKCYNKNLHTGHCGTLTLNCCWAQP